MASKSSKFTDAEAQVPFFRPSRQDRNHTDKADGNAA